jgi:hypothetical protein
MIAQSSHPAPHRHLVSFLRLLFGATAAPIFWLGQLMLGFSVTAWACYGGDHPTAPALAPLHAALAAFDGIAITAAAAGGIVAYASWRSLRGEKPGGHEAALETGEGRARFLALWGIMSSAIFLAAILFTTIATVGVPLCPA